MRIYFAADNQADEQLQKRFSRVIDLLHHSGVLVMSNIIQRNISNFTNQDLEKIGESGEILLEKVDGLIIEGTHLIPESGYLIAFALASRRPILYLLEKGKVVNSNVAHLQHDKHVAKILLVREYTDKTLEDTIQDFLHTVERGEGTPVPSIKFTLRITPRIERYLRWKTTNTTLTKADYLRKIIDDIIDHDDTYKKFIGHQDET